MKGVWSALPRRLEDMGNIVLYGPPGVGKYTQALGIIRKYSPTDLKYERKMIVPCGKTSFAVKVSDVHFEVDMTLLGCNAKSLWHSVFSQIIDVLCTKPNKQGIILCKYFSEVHSELLECFYGYMQKDISSPVKAHFIFTTEHISFFPSTVIDRCMIIPLARPTRAAYSKLTGVTSAKPIDIDCLTNIKSLGTSSDHVETSFRCIRDSVVRHIRDIDALNVAKLRDTLYDILIYNFGVYKCLTSVVEKLVEDGDIETEKIGVVLKELYHILRCYNNNYRPIYHLERFCLYLIVLIHDCEGGIGSDGAGEIGDPKGAKEALPCESVAVPP
jgi:hypothetical protein